MLFLIPFLFNSQVKGTVVDALGSPLPGVSIVVKNTTNGSSTDFDGNFTLTNVENGQTLVFSYVGFKNKEITVGNEVKINISLQDDTTSLDEVVVVGYGSTKRKSVTRAVVEIEEDVSEALE